MCKQVVEKEYGKCLGWKSCVALESPCGKEHVWVHSSYGGTNISHTSVAKSEQAFKKVYLFIYYPIIQ